MGLLLKIVLIIVVGAALLAFGIWLFLQQAQFDEPEVAPALRQPAPSITGSASYQDGKFHNLENTAVMTQAAEPTQKKSGLFGNLYKFLFAETPGAVPEQPLPSRKTDLFNLDPAENLVVWMGHSSYFIQLDGQRILIDPVFSQYASPVPGTNGAFAGTNIYTTDDIPQLDLLLISHDHWDHLDYPTIKGLQGKVKQVVTPSGVGSYFRQWGWPAEQILEGNWGDVFSSGNLDVHILPARHFSGRLFERNRTLWASFALITPDHRYYLSGDTGYGQHFKAIGDAFGPFDLAIMECGQYNANWANIHMMPEETALAATELQASKVMAAHNSKFKLSRHSWQEPLERIKLASESQSWHLLTPMIGELVDVDDNNQLFTEWWQPAEDGQLAWSR